MSLETRSTSALFKRAEQLKRWQESETSKEPTEPKHKSRKIQFTDGCVFLASCAASDRDEARKTQPSVNCIFLDLCLGSVGSLEVSLSCHLFNCSALLKSADVERVSSDILSNFIGIIYLSLINSGYRRNFSLVTLISLF
jgi:hypothetical protein